ncbi:MAG TPA: 2-C-methyl-D-erythritol 4-phosphate cytidylyltransferase [Bacteroidales bacterium]|nr:2-C-methyl-D-erythritol 4-phosphate cytidylyltransferase [Bacteroidales bacterium]
MKRFAIIVAGGTGQRMGATIPKQFLEIKKEVILMKSIRAFYLFDNDIHIIVALPEDQMDYWQSLCKKNNFEIKHTLVKGGETRFFSVKNALNTITEDGIVAIHDGVRPLVSQETIERVFEIASINENAVPYIDIVDSVREVGLNYNSAVDRNKVKLIQTPQAFRCKLIQQAYNQPWGESFTDDASVFERMGKKINLVPGNRENIKITTQVDLILAEALSGYWSE